MRRRLPLPPHQQRRPGAFAVRQLSGLIDGGVTLPAALQSVAQSSAQPTVAAELRARCPLTATNRWRRRSEKSRLLPLVERQVVVAGAEAGDLARVLARLADYLEERDALRGKLVGAMVYPAVVGVVALGVIVALLVFVMPQIVAAFAQTKQQLAVVDPQLASSRHRTAPVRNLVDRAVAGGIGVRALVVAWPVTPAWAGLLQRLPLLGPLAQSADEVRVLTTLAMLVESAVPLPRAMVAQRPQPICIKRNAATPRAT